MLGTGEEGEYGLLEDIQYLGKYVGWKEPNNSFADITQRSLDDFRERARLSAIYRDIVDDV